MLLSPVDPFFPGARHTSNRLIDGTQVHTRRSPGVDIKSLQRAGLRSQAPDTQTLPDADYLLAFYLP